ncbi:PREDICTED: probable membrane-associated kinase regulator 2 [Tarenaya hassleriana]|uniref:probable membrane-associated kinase regulator 2 n=1 Tax=Tarenaya hassleriana TaxID=28532 RepID=UPI00053C23E7|nr:PREDICTED: probable membrane-associated kinase regulator 2 [Tarenaya hassleriana]
MEAFTLLNYWKGAGAGPVGGDGAVTFMPDSSIRSPAGTTTIITSISDTDAEDDADGDDADDEGPFFDLEFAVPVEDEDGEVNHEVSEEEEPRGGGDADGGIGEDFGGTDGGEEIKFTLSSCSGGEGRAADTNLEFSPSDDVFYKGRLVAVEPPSTSTEQNAAAKAPVAQLSASLLKSATKFRVFVLGLKKFKPSNANTEKSEANSGSDDGDGEGDKQQSPPAPQQKNTLAVKLKVEEVPMISLVTRDKNSRNSSSSSSSTSSSSSSKKQNGNESAISDEKRFVMMQKYMKKVKPLYIRVSRRYSEKLRFSGQLSFGSGAPVKSTAEKTEAPAKSQKPLGSININIPAGLKVVKKHLGKSRSSSSATPPTTTEAGEGTATATATATAGEKSGRRDDSLLQQQDGIQSAILHCKRSFNSSRDGGSSVLPRSVSDPSSYDK